MRRAPVVMAFPLAALCWLAAGPGGVTVQALLACRHHAMHQSHEGHGGAPASGPCFCDEMTGGSDLAISTAVPTPPMASPVASVPDAVPMYAGLFRLPASPVFPPTPPPPNGLG